MKRYIKASYYPDLLHDILVDDFYWSEDAAWGFLGYEPVTTEADINKLEGVLLRDMLSECDFDDELVQTVKDIARAYGEACGME